MSPLRASWLVVATVIEAVSSLPFNGYGIRETADGTLALNMDGVWIFSFKEEYTWANAGFDAEPYSSRAQITLGIQASRTHLDTIVSGKPQQAIMDMTDALRSAIQAASGAFTFRDANPSFACRMLGSEQLFSDAFDKGVVQVELELRGFDS